MTIAWAASIGPEAPSEAKFRSGGCEQMTSFISALPFATGPTLYDANFVCDEGGEKGIRGAVQTPRGQLGRWGIVCVSCR